MAVQVVSDLHLEATKAYDTFEIVPRAPYLALLGDIGCVAPHKDEFLSFLTRQLRHFRAVLFVPGNHEAYHGNWPDTLQVLRDFEDDARKDVSLGDFILLDRQSFQLPGTDIVILGCSLFSFIPQQSQDTVSLRLNDFYQTTGWNTDAHNEAHLRDLTWLNAQVTELEQSNLRAIIFTHWSPSTDARATDPKHATSPISSAFSTDLSSEPCFKNPSVRVWAFGHTHYNCDFAVERGGNAVPLRVFANQYGYFFSQSPGFDVEKVIEI